LNCFFILGNNSGGGQDGERRGLGVDRRAERAEARTGVGFDRGAGRTEGGEGRWLIAERGRKAGVGGGLAGRLRWFDWKNKAL
jgi:hypothetical protein